MEHRQFVTTRIYGYVPLLVPLVATGVQGRLLAPSAVPATHLSRDILTSLDHPVPAEGGLFVAICGLLRTKEMQRVMLMTIILAFGMVGARAEVLAAQCSSYYISEINLVSTADSEAGHVQTFVGFGPSKEEAEKNALGSCLHISFDLQTCLGSDRSSSLNVSSDAPGNSLHLKYRKAVKRITGVARRPE